MNARTDKDFITHIYKRGLTRSFYVKVLGAGIGFGVQIVLARILGVEKYGIYVFAMSWMYILAMVSKLGLDIAVVRFVPTFSVHSEWGHIRGFLQISVLYIFLSSVTVAALAALIILFNQNTMIKGQAEALWLAVGSLPVVSILGFTSSSLIGQKKIIKAELPDAILRPILLVCMVIVTYLYLNKTISPSHVVALNLMAAVTALTVSLVLLVNNLPENVKSASPLYKDNILTTSLPLLLQAGFYLIMVQTDILMLGTLYGPNYAGLYSPASRLVSFMSFIVAIFTVSVNPLYVELNIQKKKLQLQQLITGVTRNIFLCGLIFSVILGFFGKYILSVYGSEFVVVYLPMLVLIIGQMTNMCTVAREFMVMTGYQNQSGYIMLISLIINISLNYSLIPVFGMIGAALSTTISLFLMNSIMALYVMKATSINTSIIIAKSR